LGLHTPRIQLSYMNYHTPMMIEGVYPKGTVILSFVRTEGKVHEKNRTYESDTVITLADNKAFDLIVSKPHEIYTIAVEETLFKTVFQNCFNRLFSTVERSEDIFFASEEVIEKYIAAFKEWMEVLREKSGEQTPNEIYREIEEKMLSSLFTFYSFRAKEINYLPKCIRETRAILRQYITDTYTISDLVDELQISPRTLQYDCKKYLGFTPKEYQQYIRLNEIRKTLLESKDAGLHIADIAHKYNFFHMGHFSSEYKKTFGETPSQTLRRT